MQQLTKRIAPVFFYAATLIAGCGSASHTESAADAGGVPTSTPAPGPTMAAARTATISNTGSTNIQGYSLVVILNPDGTVLPANLSPTLVTQLFADLNAANPVSSLPQVTCVKSASFGSSTYVQYMGSLSPDLQCQSSSAIGTALNQDVNAIAQALDLAQPKNPALQ